MGKKRTRRHAKRKRRTQKHQRGSGNNNMNVNLRENMPVPYQNPFLGSAPLHSFAPSSTSYQNPFLGSAPLRSFASSSTSYQNPLLGSAPFSSASSSSSSFAPSSVSTFQYPPTNQARWNRLFARSAPVSSSENMNEINTNSLDFNESNSDVNNISAVASSDVAATAAAASNSSSSSAQPSMGTCYDFIMLDHVNSQEYLNENPNHILLIENNDILCTTREDIIREKIRFYECKYVGPQVLVTKRDPIINNKQYIAIGVQNYLIDVTDLEKLRNRAFSIYKLIKTSKKLRATVSVGIANQGNQWASGYHCQEGSGQHVYRLEGYSVRDGLRHLPQRT